MRFKQPEIQIFLKSLFSGPVRLLTGNWQGHQSSDLWPDSEVWSNLFMENKGGFYSAVLAGHQCLAAHIKYNWWELPFYQGGRDTEHLIVWLVSVSCYRDNLQPTHQYVYFTMELHSNLRYFYVWEEGRGSVYLSGKYSVL